KPRHAQQAVTVGRLLVGRNSEPSVVGIERSLWCRSGGGGGKRTAGGGGGRKGVGAGRPGGLHPAAPTRGSSNCRGPAPPASLRLNKLRRCKFLLWRWRAVKKFFWGMQLARS